MFKRINNRKEAVLLGFIFLLTWLPLFIFLAAAILISWYISSLELGFVIIIFLLGLLVFVAMLLTMTNLLTFFREIDGQGFYKLVQILSVVFITLSILIIRPNVWSANIKLMTTGDQLSNQLSAITSYSACQQLLNGDVLDNCAQIVLDKTGDLKGCLELSAATAQKYYPNKDWDKNGFNCYANGSNYDARTLTDPNLNKILADYAKFYEAKQQAELTRLKDQAEQQKIAENITASLKEAELTDFIVFNKYTNVDQALVFGQQLGCQDYFSFRYPGIVKPNTLYLPCKDFYDFYYNHDKFYYYTKNANIEHTNSSLLEWKSDWEQKYFSLREAYQGFLEYPARTLELKNNQSWQKQAVRDFNLIKKTHFYVPEGIYTVSISNYFDERYPDAYNFWLVFLNGNNITTGPIKADNYYILFNDYANQLSCDNYQQALGQTLNIDSFDGNRIKLSGQGILKCNNGENKEYRINFDNENNFSEMN